MFTEYPHPTTIQQAIERTEREAEDSWGTWGITPLTSAYAIHRKLGGFGRERLAREAAERLNLLRDAYERAER